MYKKPELICNPKEFEHCRGTTFHVFLKFTNLAVFYLSSSCWLFEVFMQMWARVRKAVLFTRPWMRWVPLLGSGEGKVTDGLEGSCCRVFRNSWFSWSFQKTCGFLCSVFEIETYQREKIQIKW